MLYKAVGKEPNFFYAPLWLFDTIIDSLQWFADTFNSEKFENAAELGRIGKYYAVEDMLTTDPSEKFGTMTLQEHYNKIAVEGQEYDPYTTMYVRCRFTLFACYVCVPKSHDWCASCPSRFAKAPKAE